MDQETIIASVIFTLNKLEVKGKENLSGLLACIQTLERLKDTITGEGTKYETDNQQRACL